MSERTVEGMFYRLAQDEIRLQAEVQVSADSWRVCPKCGKSGDGPRAKAEKAARDSYGKDTAEEYARLLDLARAMPYDEPEETMREDYEFYYEDGAPFILNVRYGCSCKACGFEFSIHTKHDIRKATK